MDTHLVVGAAPSAAPPPAACSRQVTTCASSPGAAAAPRAPSGWRPTQPTPPRPFVLDSSAALEGFKLVPTPTAEAVRIDLAAGVPRASKRDEKTQTNRGPEGFQVQFARRNRQSTRAD
jgi:hypothetical protein